MRKSGPPDSPDSDEGSNPYRTPTAPVSDGSDEASFRRDGRHLVISRHGALSSLCGHCGSQHDLKERTVSITWRHPVGCLTTIAAAIAVIIVLAASEQIPYRGTTVPLLVVTAALVVFIVNIVWRSRRVTLIYALCLACRARRGRWTVYWLAAYAALAIAAYLLHIAVLFGLLPMYVIAQRLQPAAITPARVVGDRIWLRGVGLEVRNRFPPMEAPE